ncbi:VOC family protein [Clostridium oceanicum]|uniref:VOC domain-containing protein n=1 Tax=Clostridium oceanicum TaxID=1543 RepID=A0ABP3UKA2_9CLOT
MKLEVNMVVSNAREAADYYSNLFNATILSKTDETSEMNETRMKLGNTEIRVLNENKDYGLIAPSEGSTSSMWLNLYVKDIESSFNNAVSQGCKVISPINDFPEIPARNAVISDKFNHVWVINQKYD